MNSSNEPATAQSESEAQMDVGSSFLALHKESIRVIKNNLFSVFKFTAPFILVCFLWSAFIGERYANQVESFILAIVIALPMTFACIFIIRSEFLKEYEQSFFDLFSEKAFLLIFIYFLLPKVIGTVADFVNAASSIQGYDEFYAPLVYLLTLYFWFRYQNIVYYACLFKDVALKSAINDHKSFYLKNFANITLLILYIGLTFWGLVLVLQDNSIFPNYLSKPFFVLFNWMIGLLVGVVISSSLVAVNRARLSVRRVD
jgi:hypothetical protein